MIWQCDRWSLRWPFMTPAFPCSHLCVNPSSWVYMGTCDLLLTNGIWQRWFIPIFKLWYIRFCLADWSQSLFFWTKWNQKSCWVIPHGKELPAALRNCGWLLGPKGDLQPIASNKPESSSIWSQGNTFCQKTEWVWKQILPQIFRWDCILTHTLIHPVRPWTKDPAMLYPSGCIETVR